MREMDESLRFFAERVKAARNLRGMYQADLAEAIGFNQRVISEIEQGTRDVRLTTIKRLAKALRVSVDWLLKEEPVGNELLGMQAEKASTETKPKKALSQRGAKKEPAR